MTYEDLLLWGVEQLKAAGLLEDAQEDAMWLLLESGKMRRASYLLNRKKEAADAHRFLYEAYISRRSQYEPVAYILGEWEFMGLPFKTTPAVLIPRQDTETLVEKALEIAEKKIVDESASQINILDLCTGSGCIAVSIYHYLKERFPKVTIRVSATDLSSEALTVAKENAAKNLAPIQFYQGDLWKATDPKGAELENAYDLILSNPPYIDAPQMKTLPKDVGEFEPVMALAGGEDGLIFYRELADKAAEHLADGGWMLWEIGDEQRESTKELIEKQAELSYEGCLKDLAGHDRVTMASKR